MIKFLVTIFWRYQSGWFSWGSDHSCYCFSLPKAFRQLLPFYSSLVVDCIRSVAVPYVKVNTGQFNLIHSRDCCDLTMLEYKLSAPEKKNVCLMPFLRNIKLYLLMSEIQISSLSNLTIIKTFNFSSLLSFIDHRKISTSFQWCVLLSTVFCILCKSL